MFHTLRRRAARAFTLIELIVVVVIIGVLAAIASVSYNQFVSHARDKVVLASATDIAEAVNAAAAAAGTSTAAVLAASTYADGALILPNGVTSRVAGGALTTTGSGTFTVTDGDSGALVTGSTDSALTATVSALDAAPAAPAEVPMAIGDFSSATGNESAGYLVSQPSLGMPSANTAFTIQCGRMVGPTWTVLYTAQVTSDSIGSLPPFTIPTVHLLSPGGAPIGIQAGSTVICDIDGFGGEWVITR